jgi:hypothetical protein
MVIDLQFDISDIVTWRQIRSVDEWIFVLSVIYVRQMLIYVD